MSSENGDDGEPGDEPASDTGDAGGQPPEGADQPRGEGGQPQGGRAQGGQPPQEHPQGGQPQQGPPPQGRPPQGQPARRGPSFGQQVQATFGDYAVKNQIKAVLGLWALIGLGLGLTPVLLGLLGPGGAILGGIGAGIALAAGPIIGGLLGLSLSTKMPGETGPIALVSGVINYAGFVIMVVVFGVLLMAQSGGGGGAGLGNLIGPLILTGIPVAITAGGATAIGGYVDYPATREEAEAQEPPARPAPRGGQGAPPTQGPR